jgi:hypothetical protein
MHAEKYKEFVQDDRKAKDKIDNNPFKKKSKFSLTSSQKRITDYKTISSTMKLAVNLVVNRGVPFSTFNDENMRKLTISAKKGMNDNSSKAINAENIRAAIGELAKEKRLEITKLLQRKTVSLTADLATCESRSFLGNIEIFKIRIFINRLMFQESTHNFMMVGLRKFV